MNTPTLKLQQDDGNTILTKYDGNNDGIDSNKWPRADGDSLVWYAVRIVRRGRDTVIKKANKCIEWGDGAVV